MKSFLGALGGCFLGAMVVASFRMFSLHVMPLGITYADLAATVLSAVSVLLAILGLFIAVLAIWGLSQFRGLARKTAAEAAKESIDLRIHEGDLKLHFENMATAFLEAEFKSGTLRTLVEERVNFIIFGGRKSPSDGAEDEVAED